MSKNINPKVRKMAVKLTLILAQVYDKDPKVNFKILTKEQNEAMPRFKIVDVDFNNPELDMVLIDTVPLENPLIDNILGNMLRRSGYDEGFIMRMMFQPLICVDYRDNIIRVKNKQIDIINDFLNQYKNQIIKLKFSDEYKSSSQQDKDLFEDLLFIINLIMYYTDIEKIKRIANRIGSEFRGWKVNYNDDYNFLTRLKNYSELHKQSEEMIQKMAKEKGSNYKKYEEE